ncbi:hypothetical protein F5B19DRAFT_362601 [Rostrohypoxylon terebratum]|nr:hypothetical protein F5B19DRAFT_362601 [Rostrohypoxylon terebratum]
MASNEASQPATEARNDAISPIDNSTRANQESVPATIQAPPVARQQPNQLPYAPFPYPPQPYYTQPVRLLPRFSKSWTHSKLTLTLSLVIVGIIVMALGCVFVTDATYEGWVAAYALPISIASILWNGAELITFAVRSRKNEKRGIHPGAHVGLHLCFWIACVFAALLSITEIIVINSDLRDCQEEKNSRYSYSYSNCEDYDGLDMNGRYLPMMRAIAAFFCLMVLLHFILFVFACIDTHKRNLLKPAGMIVPPMAPQPGVAPYYPYPAPMVPQQVPFATQPKAPVAEGQNYQNLAGFYAPAPPQPAYTPAQAAAVPNPNNEKVVPTVSA